LFVVSFDEIAPMLSDEARRHLTTIGRHLWSGGAASHALPTGEKLIILNPTHHRNRQKATLMEEICHVFLGHEPSRLSVETRNKHGEVIARDYNHAIEEEAYSTGAAALVPYTAVKRMVADGMTSQQIARHFAVSRQLVEYRIKVSRLWPQYKLKQGLTDGPDV
jgi:Zn-dependent peptidase ImmA (M78 family)